MGEASGAVGVVVSGVQAGGGRRKRLCQLRTSALAGPVLYPARRCAPSTCTLFCRSSTSLHTRRVTSGLEGREQSPPVVSGQGAPSNKSLKLTPQVRCDAVDADCRGSLRAGESAAQLNSMLSRSRASQPLGPNGSRRRHVCATTWPCWSTLFQSANTWN